MIHEKDQILKYLDIIEKDSFLSAMSKAVVEQIRLLIPGLDSKRVKTKKETSEGIKRVSTVVPTTAAMVPKASKKEAQTLPAVCKAITDMRRSALDIHTVVDAFKHVELSYGLTPLRFTRGLGVPKVLLRLYELTGKIHPIVHNAVSTVFTKLSKEDLAVRKEFKLSDGTILMLTDSQRNDFFNGVNSLKSKDGHVRPLADGTYIIRTVGVCVSQKHGVCPYCDWKDKNDAHCARYDEALIVDPKFGGPCSCDECKSNKDLK